MAKPKYFSSVDEAIGCANYIEKLLEAERQWINNRVSWLFISQTFCIMAYTTLSTTKDVRFAERGAIGILKSGLPIFGVACCVVVGVAVFSAARVAHSLENERGRAVLYVNENSPATIPMIDVAGDLRDKRWLYWFGEMPHRLLPWVLGALWLLLMIW